MNVNKQKEENILWGDFFDFCNGLRSTDELWQLLEAFVTRQGAVHIKANDSALLKQANGLQWIFPL